MQLAVRNDRIIGAKFVQNGADGLDDFQVGFLVPSADVVGFCRHSREPARCESHRNGPLRRASHEHSFRHRKPERLPAAGIQDHQRNQLLGKLVWPVIVGAIRSERGQSVGVVVGAHQMVGCRLGCRVRAVGRIRRGLAKRQDRSRTTSRTLRRSRRAESGKSFRSVSFKLVQ